MDIGEKNVCLEMLDQGWFRREIIEEASKILGITPAQLERGNPGSAPLSLEILGAIGSAAEACTRMELSRREESKGYWATWGGRHEP